MIKEALIIFSTVLIAVLIAYSLGYLWYMQANVQESAKMSNYFKDKAIKDLNFFFGENNWRKISNKYYTIANPVLNDDEFLLRTNNIKTYTKGEDLKIILVVGNNKAVYLKDWQVKKVQEYPFGNSYIVKLSRKFFKIYTFKSDFEDFAFDRDEDFDSLKEIASTQLKQQFRFGHNDYYEDQKK